jgi:hypothetical protein
MPAKAIALFDSDRTRALNKAFFISSPAAADSYI